MSETKLKRGSFAKILLLAGVMVAAYAFWIAAWSRHGEQVRPVRVGIDSCHHCGMIVSDPRFAISVLDRDEQGHVQTRHFDDPGCFRAYAKKTGGTEWIGVAHDYRTGRELALKDAKLVDSGVETPMGSGVIALPK